jgi:poly [ADP-ribose] polymerase
MRIAPPEAPKAGYNFDKGVYLASMAEKSAGYCCSYISNNVGLLLLCEAAIGNPKVYSHFY